MPLIAQRWQRCAMHLADIALQHCDGLMATANTVLVTMPSDEASGPSRDKQFDRSGPGDVATCKHSIPIATN